VGVDRMRRGRGAHTIGIKPRERQWGLRQGRSIYLIESWDEVLTLQQEVELQKLEKHLTVGAGDD